MRRISLLSLMILFRLLLPAQYCVNGGPTYTADSNVELVYIVGESGTNINFAGCPGVVGVQNLLSYSVTLNASSTYSLYLKFGTCGGNYSGSGQAWIDFNQNSVFDPTESVATWAGTPPVATNMYNFSVPPNAVNGTTRMRVIQQEAGNLPLNPCASFSWGSVMDFSVVIQGSISCAGFEGDTKADAILVPGTPYVDTNSTYICYTNNNLVYPSPDVYYMAAVDPGLDHMKIELCGSGFDTYLTVYDLNDSLIAANDDGLTCAPQSELLMPVAGLDTVLIVVEGWGADTGTYILNISQMNVVAVDAGNAPDLVVVPNPTSGPTRITGVPVDEIRVSTPDGKHCLTVLANHEIDLSKLPDGVYFLSIRSRTSWFFRKVVVK